MNYIEYLIDVFKVPLELMRKLQLTQDELLELELTGITKDGFDLQTLTELLIKRHAKHDDTCFTIKDNIVWIECPYENNDFKTEVIKYYSNFPKYELKFINHGYNT